MRKNSEQEELEEKIEGADVLPDNDESFPVKGDDTNVEREPEQPEKATQTGDENIDESSPPVDVVDNIETIEIEEKVIQIEVEDTVDDKLEDDKQLKNLHLTKLYPQDIPETPPPTPNKSSVGGYDVGVIEDLNCKVKKMKRPQQNIKFQREERKGNKKYNSPVKFACKDLEHIVPVTEKNMADKKVKTCVPFSEVMPFATNFVDKIIDTSKKKAISRLRPDLDDLAKYYITYKMDGGEDGSAATFETYNIFTTTFPRWPSIQDFTKSAGLAAIDDFLAHWEYKENWLYCIEFLFAQSDECREFYLYDVKWSIPTKAYPVAQATASVYFTIEVSRVKPPCCPVDVTYTFECSRIVHSATKSVFHESWLFNIIDSKLNLYKQLKF